MDGFHAPVRGRERVELYSHLAGHRRVEPALLKHVSCRRCCRSCTVGSRKESDEPDRGRV
jgi:hypothetical protein